MHNIDKEIINSFRYFRSEIDRIESQIIRRAEHVVIVIADVFQTKVQRFSVFADDEQTEEEKSALDAFLNEDEEEESFTVYVQLRAHNKYCTEIFDIKDLGEWMFVEQGYNFEFYIPKKYLLSTEEEDKIWIKNLKEAYEKWVQKREEEKKVAIAQKKQKAQRKIDLKRQALNKLTIEERKALGV